jgi:glycosyltransferase involved in cell wall biosynthesis
VTPGRGGGVLRVVVVEPLGTGGMIHYAYQLATALAEAGVEVTLVTSGHYELADLPHSFRVDPRLRLWSAHDPESTAARRRSGLGRARWRIYRAARRGARGVRLAREWIRLVRYLEEARPDIVQFGKINFPFEGLFLGRLRRHGLVLADICHEFELRERREGAVSTIAARLSAGVYRSFAAIFLHGEELRQQFRALYPELAARLYVLPHGNEEIFRLAALRRAEAAADTVATRYALGPGESVVLFFGNLAPSKGIPDLLEAFALARRRVDAKLLIAGYPSKFVDVDTWRRRAGELGIGDDVIWDTRYVPMEEVEALVTRATVVVLPYRNATQSGALQVAYTFGRPVIVTRVGSLPEVVEQGESGLVVAPEAPSELARAIVTMLENPEQTARMGARARQLSTTRYSWSRIAENVVRVYDELLARRDVPLSPRDCGAG